MYFNSSKDYHVYHLINNKFVNVLYFEILYIKQR